MLSSVFFVLLSHPVTDFYFRQHTGGEWLAGLVNAISRVLVSLSVHT